MRIIWEYELIEDAEDKLLEIFEYLLHGEGLNKKDIV